MRSREPLLTPSEVVWFMLTLVALAILLTGAVAFY